MENGTKIKESITTRSLSDYKKPELYKILLLNDDFTTQDFVVAILMTIFGKNIDDAKSLMMKVHKSGQGVAGVYSYDIAASKASQVSCIATENGFPLACRLEKV